MRNAELVSHHMFIGTPCPLIKQPCHSRICDHLIKEAKCFVKIVFCFQKLLRRLSIYPRYVSDCSIFSVLMSELLMESKYSRNYEPSNNFKKEKKYVFDYRLASSKNDSN